MVHVLQVLCLSDLSYHSLQYLLLGLAFFEPFVKGFSLLLLFFSLFLISPTSLLFCTLSLLGLQKLSSVLPFIRQYCPHLGEFGFENVQFLIHVFVSYGVAI